MTVPLSWRLACFHFSQLLASMQESFPTSTSVELLVFGCVASQSGAAPVRCGTATFNLTETGRKQFLQSFVTCTHSTSFIE